MNNLNDPNLPVITKEQIRAKLVELNARMKTTQLFGKAPDGRDWNTHISESLMGTLEASDEEVKTYNKYLADLYRQAHDKVPAAMQELRGLVVTTTTNFVTATANFAQFFEIKNLADNEAPAIVNTTRQEIKASYIGQDGRNEITKLIKPRATSTPDLHELVSEEVEYRTRDIYTGDISEAARAVFDVSYDLKMQLENKLYNLLTDNTLGAFGTFDITNANQAARVMKFHSRVRSGVLPTGNDLQITGIGGSTKFGFSTLFQGIDYAIRFSGTEVEGDIRPTGKVIVPSDNISEILDGIIPTNAKQNQIAEELMKAGWMGVDYGNYSWTFVPDNFIPAKKCYFQLSKPVGQLWFKPGMADMEETVDRKKNLASRWEKIVIAAAIPTPRKKNILRVAYRT